MWLKGEWHEIEQMDFEITGEATQRYSRRVEPLAERAIEAVHQQPDRAAELLQLELEPDSPSLLNNLAMAYQMQGRQQEAEELTREIHRRCPDYLFAAASSCPSRMWRRAA